MEESGKVSICFPFLNKWVTICFKRIRLEKVWRFKIPERRKVDGKFGRTHHATVFLRAKIIPYLIQLNIAMSYIPEW